MLRSQKHLNASVLLSLVASGYILLPSYSFSAVDSTQNKVSNNPKEVRVRVEDPYWLTDPLSPIFQVFINDDQEVPRFTEVLDLNGQTFLPFKDIISFFNFAIYSDRNLSRWEGFFANTEKTFKLDIDKLELKIASTNKNITRQDVRKKNKNIYVSLEALHSWFGISSSINRSPNNIRFTTDFLLPSEAQEFRKKKRVEIFGSLINKKRDQSDFFQTSPIFSLFLNEPPSDASPHVHDFSGVTTAGYEVELYRNNELISFQYADETGRYNFQNIPLALNENVFRLAFYGPQGQYEEKSETLVEQLPIVKNFIITPSKPTKSESKENSTLKDAQTAMTISTSLQSIPIQAKNWAELSIIQSGTSLGILEAYIGVRGTFLRLDSFLRYMGVAYNQQTTSDLLEILAYNNRHITLDIAHRTYIDNGILHTLYDSDAFKNEDKIYANTDLLYRLFPYSTFIVDQALQRIEIPEQKNGGAEIETATEKADVAPTPTSAPVLPVIIDDLSGKQRLSGSTQTPKEEIEAKDVLHIEQPAVPKESVVEYNEQRNGESLILQPQLKKLSPSNEFIEALDFPEQVFLPMNDLFQIIGFPIKLDDTKNEARGFFFTSDNEFYLNIDKKEVRAGNKSIKITRRDIRKHEGQIYISTESFTEWFGITCEIDRSKSVIHLNTDKLFPEEEQQERQKQWNKLLSVVEPSDDDLPILENPYKAIEYPALDVSLGSTYTHNGTPTSQKDVSVSNYNLQGAMELGYLTSQFYVQGATDTKAINTLRFQAGRKDPTGNLLSGMNATQFLFGDVTSPSVSFVTANSLGRGFTITNRDVTSPENFDVRNFTGDSVPGYEVELYRNNVLVAFQTVDASGRYNFTDIPIIFGENTFRLVFYGNQGQREERIETISASNALLKENRFEYTLGAVQRGINLIPINQLKLTNSRTPNGTQLVGGFRYGVTKRYTIGASFAETILSDGPHRYIATSSSSNFFGILSETSFAKDLTTGGWASGMSVLSGFEGVSLHARYRQYNNFISESVNNTSQPLSSEARLDANTQVLLPLVRDFSLGLSGLREEFVDKNLVPRYTYGIQVSKSLWGFSLSNKIDYIIDEEKRFQDTFGLQTRLWNINFRAIGIYDFSPQEKFRSASFVTDYRLTDKLSGQSQLDKDLVTDKTSLGQNLNWDFETFRLSFNNQINNSGDYSVGMNVLFSINHNKATNKWRTQPQPTTSGGAIAGRVFVDENNNDIYDEGEKLLPNANVRVNRSAVKLDENGYFVAPVASYEISKVEVNTGTLSDPLLTPKTNSYRIRTRSGDTVVADFPMVHTTIIDGTAYFLEENGNKREVGNIVIEIQDKDEKPIRRAISEIDGYYSFDKIQKGEYWINVPDELLSSLNATLKEKIHIKIDEINEFITDNNLMLVQKDILATAPSFEVQEPALPPAPELPSAPTPPTRPTSIEEEKPQKDKDTDIDIENLTRPPS